MEDNLKKMEDDLKKNKNGRLVESTKINQIGCDTIVNSPSFPSYQVESDDWSFEVGGITC
jgi:hypothetical protein